MTDYSRQIQELKDIVTQLEHSRVSQTNIEPDAVKQRHVGEGVRFIRSGLAADRPTSGEGTTSGSAMYWATDTFVLSIWTGSAWKTTTLS